MTGINKYDNIPLGPYDACSPLHHHGSSVEPPNSSKTITPEAALFWLAGLEKPCPELVNHPYSYPHISNPSVCVYCDDTGTVPVLDLRAPCPNKKWHTQTPITHFDGSPRLVIHCNRCGGSGWLPRQGRDALHQAMRKKGFSVTIFYGGDGTIFMDFRQVAFCRNVDIDHKHNNGWCDGEDADDWRAAEAALRAARYK